MPESDDLEPRVDALEGEVERLQQRLRRSERDAAAARVLAGGADRDVGELGVEVREFRAQSNRTLNALREDMGDLRAHVDRGFAEVRGRLDGAAGGQQRIVDLLEVLIARDDPDAGPAR